MSRLVFVTQRVDPDDPALAATVPQLRALARRVDEVVVLTDAAIPGVLPANCRVRTFRAPLQALRGARFAAALARVLVPRPVAVVAHMCPIYAILAAPLARPLSVPVLLWFTHWRARTKLKLAEQVATRVLTVDESSFPLRSRKVVPIGHAVDLERFVCAGHAPSGAGLRLLALGRYSPSKRYEELARGVELARVRGLDATLDVYGPTLTEEERAYRAGLDSGPGVRFHEPVPGTDVPALLARYDALVSATRAGSADKAILEAAASCRPVVASTAPLRSALRFEDPEQLADRLSELARLSVDERKRLGRAGREEVERGHSVAVWAERVLAAAR